MFFCLKLLRKKKKMDLNNNLNVLLSFIFDFISKLTDDCSFEPDGIPNPNFSVYQKKCLLLDLSFMDSFQTIY